MLEHFPRRQPFGEGRYPARGVGAIEIVAVRYQGRAAMLQRADGMVVTRDWLVKRLMSGDVAVLKPEGARLYLVRSGITEFLSIDPREKNGDNLGALPTF